MSFTEEENEKFKILTAERINIVNEDGTTVIAIANKQRIANPVFNGKSYPVRLSEGRDLMAGMIFFNEEGDEMGGLVFNSFKMPNGRTAGIGHLSFDRFKDNQVINLEYSENKNGVKSGLTFYDRPGDGSFPRSLDLMNDYYFNEIDKERKKEIEDTLKIMRKTHAFGSDRLFIGSDNEVPQVTMKDVFGNERIKLFIDSSNVAKLQFFDEKGIVIGEFPNKK
ncbi:MAG: hypothetical protein CO117_05785 [Flavobacteriaceae bacterium CG_4_9_14_3_um_filter_33_16]|nr:MAG: hypothetical protein CO117_05785 [Flavobacteriaceae bacterium CG_4_9_14_3_um_filter_33_16]